MTWLNWLSSGSLIGFSLFILLASIRLNVGTVQNPGPGFMGFLASVLLLCLSSLILFRDLAAVLKKKVKTVPLDWGLLKKPAILTLSLGSYVLVLPYMGYLPATFLLLFLMLSIYDPWRWRANLLVAFLIVTASYLIFTKWLGVLLPTGLIRVGW